MVSSNVIWYSSDGTSAGVGVATLIFFFDLYINVEVSVFSRTLKRYNIF